MGYNENAGVQALKMVKCIKIYKKKCSKRQQNLLFREDKH